MWKLLIFTLTYCFTFVQIIEAFQGIPGLYCGLENCYDVLGATRDSNREDLTKLYRTLARKYHPDRFFNADEKASATEKFRLIATAYEVLKDDESRKDYNDMLDDPEHYYRHYYRYYRRVYATKVEAHWVIIGLITAISLFQHYVMHSRYKGALDYCCTLPKYRFKAQELAKQQGLLPISEKRSTKGSSSGKRSRHKSKEEIREQEERVIRQVISDNMDIRGVARPDTKNILWVWIFMLPITIYRYIAWYVRWVYLFDIKGMEYGREEKIYLMSKNLGTDQERLDLVSDIDSLLKQELWDKEKFKVWKKKKDDEIRKELASKGRYKRDKRFMKKGGPGQITFLDD